MPRKARLISIRFTLSVYIQKQHNIDNLMAFDFYNAFEDNSRKPLLLWLAAISPFESFGADTPGYLPIGHSWINLKMSF